MPQGVGTVVQVGAGLYRPTPDNELCKQWRENAKEWCAKGKPKRPGESQRNFNKRFYNDLNKNNPNLCKQFDPEIPVGFTDAAGNIQVLEKLAAAGNVGANNVILSWCALGLRFWGATAGVTGPYTDFSGVTQTLSSDPITGKSMCGALNNRIWGQFGHDVVPIHADGMLRDGTAVEIKGPGDSEKPGQFDKEKACARNGEVLIIDAEACDNEGITTKSGGCPSGGS